MTAFLIFFMLFKFPVFPYYVTALNIAYGIPQYFSRIQIVGFVPKSNLNNNLISL